MICINRNSTAWQHERATTRRGWCEVVASIIEVRVCLGVAVATSSGDRRFPGGAGRRGGAMEAGGGEESEARGEPEEASAVGRTVAQEEDHEGDDLGGGVMRFPYCAIGRAIG
jgi:hypothetical protein